MIPLIDIHFLFFVLSRAQVLMALILRHVVHSPIGLVDRWVEVPRYHLIVDCVAEIRFRLVLADTVYIRIGI